MLRTPVFLFLLACVASAGPSRAQAPGPPPTQALTLDQAIQYASDHYPAIRASIEEVNASAAGVDAARSASLPRLDAMWQSNRATANNIFGQVLPQSVIPALSGPVLPSASSQSVWSSATGALLTWEPVDLGLRHAGVMEAEAGLTQARVSETLTRLQVQSAAAQAFLAALAAERSVSAARADVERRNVLLTSVQTLVDNQLRPGADASRAEAERAAALTRLLRSQQALAIARATLNRVLGITTGAVSIVGGRLLEPLPAADITLAAASAHPLAQLRRAAEDQAQARQEVLARTDLPRLFVQGSVSARGSGANPNGVFDTGAGGLALDRVNWAAGVQIVLPNVFDFSNLRARKAAAAAAERASAALYDEALLAITSEQQTAAALLETTRAIAANTPVQLAAARQTEVQARARYQAGLATLVDVADAQSLLAQAEVEDELARVDVWRALLAAAVAQGDLAPFVRLVRRP